ncbi:nuclear transport factor 2 family protein [Caulobacter sp. UNC279MFTsu5.1]|uniref:nuclear transport factor 2 family protein n=1 Tax=Caulobacter sp. UNC279MFTsu5.1 TaxID=1502775 RepID=UPI0008F3F38F|nr:nuclear transport factor 2 family protein [Caulobacter sp. UNC279MFTsu5.1]SFJ70048.1 Putative lumazine-binding [Caulobacter sp. UNC279MFTsu5.1]
MRLILTVLTAAALSPVAARADDRAGVLLATPADAVRAYGEAIAERSPVKLGRAFQPSAIAYCTDGRTITATYQAQWKSRLAEGPAAATSPLTIERIDAGETTALARVRATRGGKPVVDYVLLARLAGGWRILATLCQPEATQSAASVAGVAGVVDDKLKADRGWDAALLGATLDPRALVTSVEDGEFVAASVAEWQARYVDRRRTSAGATFEVTSRIVDAQGDVGMARWSFRSANGEWTDRALMLRTASGWRMAALLYAREAP